MTTPSRFSSESASRQVDITAGSLYPFSGHTILAEHATDLPQLVACFALAVLTFSLPLQISLAGAALIALCVAAPLRACGSWYPRAKARGYSSLQGGLQQLVDSGARGGALSPVVELVKTRVASRHAVVSLQHPRDTHVVRSRHNPPVRCSWGASNGSGFGGPTRSRNRNRSLSPRIVSVRPRTRTITRKRTRAVHSRPPNQLRPVRYSIA